MLELDKPRGVYRDGKLVARVIATHSDMSAVQNPRREENLGTICVWNGFEDLGDDAEGQEKSMAQEIRELLKRHMKHSTLGSDAAKAALESDQLETMYLVLQTCDSIAIQLLSVKEVDNNHTIAFATDPEQANGLIYAEWEPAEDGSPLNNMPEWKAVTEPEFECEVRTYDLYLRNSVFDFIVEYWEGPGNPEEHLEDGEGFNHDLYDALTHQIIDIDDLDDSVMIEDELENFFRD